MIAACLVPIVAVTAMVLDGGMIMAHRRRAQASAAAAAHAAGCSHYTNDAVDRGANPLSTARASALAIAADHGVANDGTSSAATVAIPPSTASAKFACQAGRAEVIVTLYRPRYFSAI